MHHGCFCSCSVLIVGYSSLHCGTIPINAMVRFMNMDSDTVLGVTFLHHLFVLTESHLEVSLGLPNVNLVALLARDLVDHTSPLLWNVSLEMHHGPLELVIGLKAALAPSGVQTLSSVSLSPLMYEDAWDLWRVITCRY